MATLYKNGFNEINLKVLREMLKIKLAEIEQQTGIKLKVGNITYSKNSFDAKLKAVIPTTGTEGYSTYELLLKEGITKHGYKYSINESEFGRKKEIFGVTYTFIGIKDRAQKYPFVLKRETDGVLIKVNQRYWQSTNNYLE